MSQEELERMVNMTGICHVILQVLFFAMIWEIFYPERERKRLAGLGVLLGMNLLMYFGPGMDSWYRYPLSAALILGYAWIYCQKHLEKALFVLLLFYNFHALSFLIANSIHQWGTEWMLQRLDPGSEVYMLQIYESTAWGQKLMLASYGFVFLVMVLILGKIVKRPWDMSWQDVVFLSFPNAAGGMLARMVLDISMVKMEQGMFLLFDEKRDMVWKVPLVAIFLYMGEMSAIYIFQQYEKLQQERQKHFVEEQQMKALQRRLKEAEDFYGSIRKARHEMKNHMANLKGLVAGENYQTAERYMEKLEETMETLDYQFATGNPVTDVVINDKYRKGKALGIDFQVQFCYEAGDGISVFDMGILLNNLLDNAMEACEKLEQSQRYIRLALKRKDHFLLLEVENSFDGVIKWEQGSPVPASRKEKEPGAWMEHGIGLKNVKEIAERYLGVMDIKIKGNIFRITVMLQEEG